MKNLVMYRQKYVREEINEETGEVITPSHTERELFTIPLDNIIKVNVRWGSMEVLTLDAQITKYDEVDELYFC